MWHECELHDGVMAKVENLVEINYGLLALWDSEFDLLVINKDA